MFSQGVFFHVRRFGGTIKVGLFEGHLMLGREVPHGVRANRFLFRQWGFGYQGFVAVLALQFVTTEDRSARVGRTRLSIGVVSLIALSVLGGREWVYGRFAAVGSRSIGYSTFGWTLGDSFVGVLTVYSLAGVVG